jgi:hypothetical protein
MRCLAIMLLGFLVCASARAEYVAFNDPAAGRFVAVLENGVEVTVDAAQQMFFVRNAASAQFSLTFAQVAAELESSAAGQAALINRWTQTIHDPSFRSAFTGYTTPTLSLVSGDGGGGGDLIVYSDDDSAIERGRAMGRRGTERSHGRAVGLGDGEMSLMGGCGWDDPYNHCACYFAPCSPVWELQTGRFYYMSDLGTERPMRDMTAEEQRCRANHYDDWQAARGGSCQGMRDSMVDSAFAAVGIVIACPASLTVIGAVGCAASVSGLVVTTGRVARAAESCAANYPGPGSRC